MSESKATEGHPDGHRGPVTRAESDVHSCSEAVTGIGAVKRLPVNCDIVRSCTGAVRGSEAVDGIPVDSDVVQSCTEAVAGSEAVEDIPVDNDVVQPCSEAIAGSGAVEGLPVDSDVVQPCTEAVAGSEAVEGLPVDSDIIQSCTEAVALSEAVEGLSVDSDVVQPCTEAIAGSEAIEGLPVDSDIIQSCTEAVALSEAVKGLSVDSDVVQQCTEAIAGSEAIEGHESLVPVSITGARIVSVNEANNAFTFEITENITDVVETYVPASIISATGDNTDNLLQYFAGCLSVVPSETSTGCEDRGTIKVSVAEVPSESKVRKRKRNPKKHNKAKRKILRNSGQEYLSRTGHICEARTLGPSCKCRRQCFDILSESHCEFLCNQFWNLGDFSTQNAYLFGQIKSYRPMRRRPLHVVSGNDYRKQYSFAYYVKSASEGDIRVCKEAFLNVHGLQKSRGRLENILTDIVNGSGVPKGDGRGKHSNRPNRTSCDVVECVKAHISSFPTYQSHYSRRDNINRVYLVEDLNISKLHRLYVEISDEKNWPQVTLDVYRRIFCENFNIGFKLPQTDTCKVCDKYSVDLQAAAAEDRANLQQLWNEHKQQASAAFDMLSNDTKQAKESPVNGAPHVICFDLQQALPTPKLSSGPAFYKRKLWTYNFCIHDTCSNTASMFLWPESTAGRGSNEIASCILQYFKNTEVNAKTLVAYSDNCAGQNKNFNVLSLWQYLIATNHFEEIRHVFPVSGHTMMPCDRDFGDVERKLRRKKCIYVPSDYIELIKESRAKHRFVVNEMTRDKFVNIETVSKMLTKRNVTSDKQKIDFRQVHQFRFTRGKPQHVEVKLSHDANEQWKLISLQKRGRPAKLSEAQLLPLYDGPRPIAKAKVDDVKSLFPYIPPVHHAFYNDIVVDNRKNRTDFVEVIDDGDCD